ncbi:cytochrome c class I [Arachidicoccus soli]|uniref:Cytochrome c class I n=1 Tax=Arachidicoccus soli TaxID=2341117 RepID=A0A386HTX1_9BACT|nr:cytochrome c class I [Arachidicoccus soli]
MILISCGSNNGNTEDSGAANNSSEVAGNSNPSAKTDINKDPNYQKGLALVAKNGCFTCHKVDGESTGPAYVKVANKYDDNDANINMLAQKVISGGSGHWGTVPMIPHPTVSLADAKQMVKYVLMLRTKK